MTRLSRLALAGGAVLFTLGVALTLAPGLATVLSVQALVEAVGSDYFLVAALGLLAALVALGVMVGRARGGFDQARPPTAESVPQGTPLGGDVDRVVQGDVPVREYLVGDVRHRVHARLQRAAVGTVHRTERCPRSQAERQVRTGEWTDDPVAAAFLADGSGGVTSAVSRVADTVVGQARFRRQTERTVQAILARDDGGGR